MNNKNLVTIPSFTLTKKMLIYIILIVTLLALLVLAANHIIDARRVENLKQLPDGLSTEQAVKSILLVSSENILSKDFENLVDQTNINAIQYLSDNIGLSNKEYELALKNYAQNRDDVLEKITDGMKQESSGYLDNPNSHFEHLYENTLAVSDYQEITSGIICSTAFAAIDVADKNPVGLLASSLIDPCSDILKNALQPLAEELHRHAVIEDINTISLDMTDQAEKTILELATAESNFNYNVNINRHRKVWVFNGSTNLSAQANVKIKTGFDLTNNFSITANHNEKTLNISLPQPMVLSKNISYDFGDVEKSFLIGPSSDGIYNELQYKANQQLEYLDLTSAYNRSKENASTALENIFTPLISMNKMGYKVEVTYD